MKLQLVNAKIFGKSIDQHFDLVISDGILSSIYPNGVNREYCKTLDLQGAWIAPAFVDSHVHLTNTGVALAGLDLSRCDSYEALVSALELVPKGDGVIIGHGWDDSKWAKKADSDVFAEGCPPIYISRIDAHSALASKALLKQLPHISELHGFSKSLPITSDAHGAVREFAYSSLTTNQRRKFIEIAIKEFLANGINQVHEMAGPKISSFEDAQLVKDISANLSIDTKIWWGELNGHQRALQLNSAGCGGDLFIDGSFGSKTAFLTAEYESGGFGNQYITSEQALRHILEGYEFGLPTSFHVIGDAAIAVALEAFSDAKSILGSTRYLTLNHRLEHVEFLHEENFKEISDLNLHLSMQPQFSQEWAGPGGMYEMRIGNRWNLLNPLRPLLNAGSRISFGSDSPVTAINPWKTITAATNMHNPEFSITQKAAFRAHTDTSSLNNSIEVGTRANFAVWKVEQWHKLEVDQVRHRWSTDSASFPNDYPDPDSLPECLMTFNSGQVAFNKFEDGNY